MLDQSTLPPDFDAILDPGEKLRWIGRPIFVPFVAHAVPFLICGLIWGLFDLGFGGIFLYGQTHAAHSHAAPPPGLPIFVLAFLAVHSFPFWGSILFFFYTMLVHKNTVYAYTERRMLMRSGLIGTSFKAIDYDGIQDLQVTVGPIERLFNAGTIRAFSGRTTSKGTRITDQFVSVPNPYEVFRGLKQIELDAKTDWEYPNKLRPAENPGYHTEYQGARRMGPVPESPQRQ